MGRTGTLAVALGIGTAAATGLCLSCGTASAETGDRGSSSGGSNTSNSQSVEANRRGSRLTGSSVLAGSLRAPADAKANSSQHSTAGAAKTKAAAAKGASRSDTSDRLTAPAEIQLDLPDATMAPAPAAPTAFQSAAVPLHAPVVVAAPAVASTTTLTNAVTSLSDPSKGAKPSVPADSALALLLGSARRETTQAPLAAASRSVKTTAAAATSSSTTTAVEAEKMAILRSGTARVVSDNKASGRKAMAVVGSGSVSTTVTIASSTALTIRARTSSGSPNMTVAIDGKPITTVVVSSASYADYTFAGAIPAGTHSITISSSNATSQSTLYLDKVSTTNGAIGDQFTGSAGSAANSTMWTTTIGTGWDSGIQNYTSSGAFLDGQGNLVIQSTKTATGEYTSGRVQTANKMSFGYGTISARIKVPEGQALWPAFWLIGADEAANSWPAVGEIDVMELPGTTTTMYSTLHGPIAGTTATQQAQIVSNLPDLSQDYHNYWVRHLENEITFGVDGQTLGTLTPNDLEPGETWVYNRPMSVIINLAVGGSWAGLPGSATPDTAQMLVDSVTFTP